ncbi:MAG: hypothetical protein QM503_03790 [Bacteroidota bacterium]
MKLAAKGGQEVNLEVNVFFDIAASDTVNVSHIGANFHVNKTGWYNILPTGNVLPRKVYLIAGMPYPFRIRRLFATNTEHADGLVGIKSVTVTDDKA